MLGTILTTVLTALVIAAVFGALKSRWLYVVVPKPYLNTPLSNGQVIALTIANAGFLVEEDIVVRLNPAARYEMVASSHSTVALANHAISLPRLPRFESVTLFLLVEGRPFELSDIESAYSKAATGKRVDKKESVSSIWHALIAVPVLLLLLTLPFAIGTVVGKQSGFSAFEWVSTQVEHLGPSKQLAGYTVRDQETYAHGTLNGALRNDKISLKITEIIRRGDILDIQVTFGNHLPQPLVAEVSAISSAADAGPLDFWDSRIRETFVPKGATSTKRLRAYLPESSNPKLVVLQYRLKHVTDSASIEQTIAF